MLQRLVIFDDPVVHEHTAAGSMWMGVLLRWFPVGRPSRVPNANRSFDRLFIERFLQIDELADTPAHLDRSTLQNRDTG
jgi:hypothetical protein